MTDTLIPCPACGADNAAAGQHCTACGAALGQRPRRTPTGTLRMPPVLDPAAAQPSPPTVGAGAYAPGSLPENPTPTLADRRDILVVTAGVRLVGLDARSGGLLWYNQLAPQGHHIAGLLIQPPWVMATTSAPLLFCLDYPTGRTRWTAPLLAATRALRATEDRLFVAHGDTVSCFNFQGYRLWSQPLSDTAGTAVALELPSNRA